MTTPADKTVRQYEDHPIEQSGIQRNQVEACGSAAGQEEKVGERYTDPIERPLHSGWPSFKSVWTMAAPRSKHTQPKVVYFTPPIISPITWEVQISAYSVYSDLMPTAAVSHHLRIHWGFINYYGRRIQP